MAIVVNHLLAICQIRILNFQLKFGHFNAHMRLQSFIFNILLLKATENSNVCWDLDSLEWQQFFIECSRSAHIKNGDLISNYPFSNPQHKKSETTSNSLIKSSSESEPLVKRRCIVSESISSGLDNSGACSKGNGISQAFGRKDPDVSTNVQLKTFKNTNQGNYSSIEDYHLNFKRNNKFFIDTFCMWDQSHDIKKFSLDINKKLDCNFEKLELNFETALKRYAEILSNSKSQLKSVESIEKMLCRPGLRKIYHLLIYSLYETFLIGNPDNKDAVETIMIDIIFYLCLKAYGNNEKVKKSMNRSMIESREGRIIKEHLPLMNKLEYADFTTDLCYCEPTHMKVNQSAIFIKTEILKNLHAIIEKEFEVKSKEKYFCTSFYSKPLKFYQNQFLKEMTLAGKPVFLLNPKGRSTEDDKFSRDNGYPSDILAFFMVTVTEINIRPASNLRLKAVIILIHIIKICIHETQSPVTFFEYLMLIGSLHEEYLRYERTEQVSEEFRSMVYYFFSINYLGKDNGQTLDDKARTMKLLYRIFPKYNVIFPSLKTNITRLRQNSA